MSDWMVSQFAAKLAKVEKALADQQATTAAIKKHDEQFAEFKNWQAANIACSGYRDDDIRALKDRQRDAESDIRELRVAVDAQAEQLINLLAMVGELRLQLDSTQAEQPA